MKRLLPLLSLWLCMVSRLAADAPNVLLILTDDHSYPFLGCYGDTNVRTPNLDQLATQGMRFHRFFTAAPQCVPSRAAIVTGRSPVAARMTRFSSTLPRDEVTFLEILREKAGYYTGIVGRSYHLDGSGGNANNTIGRITKEHALVTFPDRVDYVTKGSDTAAVEQMREFLDRKPAGKPFVLWLNFSDPHHPWTAPDSDRPDPAALKLPGYLPDLPGTRSDLAAHLGEINRVDQRTKVVLDLLAARGFEGNMLVIFAGDNGSALPHGKGSLYDPGSHVPLLIRWPGVIRPGSESRGLLSGEDLAPTILEAAGIEPHPRMSGRSFLGLLKGEPSTPRPYVFFERGPHGTAPVTVNLRSNAYDLGRAVRSDRYKLIYNCTPWVPYQPVDSAGEPGWREISAAHASGKLDPKFRNAYFMAPRPVYELFDLEADPSELHNLSGRPELRDVERTLRVALAEKMIVDFDYLPLPDLMEEDAPRQKR